MRFDAQGLQFTTLQSYAIYYIRTVVHENVSSLHLSSVGRLPQRTARAMRVRVKL